MQTTHVILPGSYRGAARGAVRVADIDPNREIELVLDLAPRGALPTGRVDKTWSTAEISNAFAATPETVELVTRVLRDKYGIAVTGQSTATPSLYVKGKAADIERAFHAGLSIYRSADQGMYVGRREGAHSIPAELAGRIVGVHGLDGRRVFRRARQARVGAAAAAAGTKPGMSPSALEQHYAFPAGDGAGQKIAIAEFGGAVFEDDLALFAQEFKRPVPTVAVKTLGTKQEPSDLDTSTEVNMDVQIIAGLCPKAELVVYFAKFTQAGFLKTLDQVVADRPVALSVSYGVSEDNKQEWSATALAAINARLNAARLAGITVCVSSGDDGTGCDMFDGHAHVEFPSSSPYVLAVGGTKIAQNQEVTWWDKPGTRFEPNSEEQTGGGSTGGGVSDRFPKPEWQTIDIASINPAGNAGRIVPDVAALAGMPGSTCLLRAQQQDGTVGRFWEPGMGTSAATPIWAALIARVNALLPAGKQQRFLAPLLYAAAPGGGTVGATACAPITTGNNASQPDPGVGYHATAGFSAVTGWGVPSGTKLLEVLELV